MSRRRQLVQLAAVLAGVLLVPRVALAAGADVTSAGAGVWAFLGGYLGNITSRWLLLRRHEETCTARVKGDG